MLYLHERGSIRLVESILLQEGPNSIPDLGGNVLGNDAQQEVFLNEKKKSLGSY